MSPRLDFRQLDNSVLSSSAGPIVRQRDERDLTDLRMLRAPATVGCIGRKHEAQTGPPSIASPVAPTTCSYLCPIRSRDSAHFFFLFFFPLSNVGRGIPQRDSGERPARTSNVGIAQQLTPTRNGPP